MKTIFCVVIFFLATARAVPNVDCSIPWNRWYQCPLPPPPIDGGFRHCFIDGNQVFVLTLSTKNGLALNCQGESPDPLLVNCLNVTALYGLGMMNCQFSSFILKDYIYSKNTVFVDIIYDSERILVTSLIISDLPLLRNISITGLRSTELLNVTFKSLPDLYLLNITDHNFTIFHKQPFASLYSLQGLSLRLGIIEMIPDDLFYGLENLRFLDLSRNRIKDIRPKTFNDLTLLLDLDLTGNHIEQLPSVLFTNLKSLSTLHIGSNKLTSLPSDLFQYILNLILLIFSGNTLKGNLPEGFLNGAANLEKICAMNCSMDVLQNNLFSDTKYLTYVALSLNRLRFIPPGLFNNTENLLYLFLDLNEISHLNSRTFSRLFRLLILSISYNELASLDRDSFAGLSSLSSLNLSNNRLSSITDSIFNALVNLQELDISNNPLITLPLQFPFGKSKYLSTAVMTNCHLSKIPNINWMLGNLTFLDFSYNFISNVTLPVFTANRIRVMLNDNNISSIRLDFENMSSMSPYYSIRNNSLHCDCNLQEFIQFLHSDIQKKNFVFIDVFTVKCFGPKTKSILDIWPPYKTCPLTSSDCPTTCQCYKTTENKVVIECSNKSLIHAPKALPLNTAIINLSNNNITELPSDDPKSWRNIEELFLSNNSLESLEDWHIAPKLKVLAVDGNLLSNLPSTIMEKIDSVPDFQIYLAENSWQCNCQLISFKRWFDKNKHKIQDANSTFCSRQNQGNRTLVQSLIVDTPVDLFCLEVAAPPAWLTATITIGVLVILFISCAVCYYRYHNTILSILYSRNVYCFWWDRRDSDEDKLFDAFICYSSTDRDIVMSMIKELEPSYKLCIHERDWLPGYNISYHIVNSVQTSRKTLLLLSNTFLESIWFQVEFRTAYTQMIEDRVHRLVLIIVEDIGKVSKLEEELRHLVSTKTYLKWGETWFWEKLRYTLRRPGLKNDSID